MLTPGVTYDRRVEFTRHGPVVLHVLEAPRPGGLYRLAPVLSNGAIAGRETVSAMQRRLGATATVAGVNGDFFAPADGSPSGVLIQGGVLQAPPNDARSALGIDAAGRLRVDRLRWFGTWQGTGQRRTINALNGVPGANGISLYTPAWGTNTPVVDGATVVVLQPFPAALPNVDLSGTVAAVARIPTSAIPADGAVLVARGIAGQKLAAEVASGGTVMVRLLLAPDWQGIVHAIGGGPALVRAGAPIFRPSEAFTTDQLLPRQPRTAVGQRADGSLVLLAVDGRGPGYSSGMTNYELAVALARLGVVTGMALEAGGSTTLAFEGEVLNRPSEGEERAVSEGLFVFYEGVHAPPPAVGVLTFDGDGIDERQELAYKVVRPSAVTASLVAPDRSVKFTESMPARAAGAYRYSFNGATFGSSPLQGRWRWLVTATDDLGRQSAVDRGFWVNSTLRGLDVSPRLLRAGAKGAELAVGVTIESRARLKVTVETPAGVLIRTLANASLDPGTSSYAWDGRDTTRALAYTGQYLVRATTENAFGPMELVERFAVQRVVVKPKTKKAAPKKRPTPQRGQ